ncbi:MAG TPA: class I SAM-dependent methyltransferase [Bryobacteraceae bacterium]|nr:class I SAM-dependent methyltransferase [Bryobacteraceae bacterium]
MFLDPLQRRFRARRMALLASAVGLRADMRVLDVGGTIEIWRLAPVMPRVVLLNQAFWPHQIEGAEGVIRGDGTTLPFADQSFDLVFSNSVIEHVGDAGQQTRFAREIARVGKCYWVQTPSRYFPIEHHLWTPFIHWLPRSWQAAIVKRFSIWSLMTRHDAREREYYLKHYLETIRLLSAAELGELFPDASVLHERTLGWTKSLVAWRANGRPTLP